MSDDPLGVGFGGVCARLWVSEVEAEDAWWSTSVDACLLQVINGLLASFVGAQGPCTC